MPEETKVIQESGKVWGSHEEPTVSRLVVLKYNIKVQHRKGRRSEARAMAERIGNPGLGRPTTDEKNAIDEMSEQVAGTNILEWSVLDVHHLLAALGFSQYLGQLQGEYRTHIQGAS